MDFNIDPKTLVIADDWHKGKITKTIVGVWGTEKDKSKIDIYLMNLDGNTVVAQMLFNEAGKPCHIPSYIALVKALWDGVPKFVVGTVVEGGQTYKTIESMNGASIEFYVKTAEDKNGVMRTNVNDYRKYE